MQLSPTLLVGDVHCDDFLRDADDRDVDDDPGVDDHYGEEVARRNERDVVVVVVDVGELSSLCQNLRRNYDSSPRTRVTPFEDALKVRSAICRYVLNCRQRVENKREYTR